MNNKIKINMTNKTLIRNKHGGNGSRNLRGKNSLVSEMRDVSHSLTLEGFKQP